MTPIDALVDKHIFGRGEEYYVRKHGLYYRPPQTGYTGNKSEAARYSLERAKELCGGSWEVTYIACEPEPYSTDIAAAMDVVKKMKEEGISVDLNNDDHDGDYNTVWHCMFLSVERDIVGMADESTAPLAICLAALKVKGITQPTMKG